MIKALLIINDHYSYAVSIVLYSLTIVVIVVLMLGLCLGLFGYVKFTEHYSRKEISKPGGIILLMLAIY